MQKILSAKSDSETVSVIIPSKNQLLIRKSFHDLRGIRVLLVNPRTFPYDLRGEMHAPDTYKSERAINFGLLVIASVIARAGAKVQIFDQESQPNNKDYSAFLEAIERESPHVVGTGIISVYQYLGAIEVLRLAKPLGIITVLGGQASGGFAEELLRSDSPCDYVFRGDAEETFPSFLSKVLQNKTITRVVGLATRGESPPETAVVESLDSSSELEYELYPNWKSHFPLVEESRACPYRCSFCANESIANADYRGKPPEKLLREVERAIRIWGGGHGSPVVLQCAIFGTQAQWTEEFLKLTQRSRLEPRFLAALRVDNHWERYVKFTRGIFDQVHFGFESGSPDILSRMLKTARPEKYLERSAAAFKAFHSEGVHVGINLVIGYYGETYRSVGDTLHFILENRHHIDSAWGGPFVLYPDTPARKELEAAFGLYGSRRVTSSPYCNILNTYPIQASSNFTHADAISVGEIMMRLLNDESTYYDHYKWYVGPRTDVPLSFFPKDMFYDVMFKGRDMQEKVLDLTTCKKS